MGMSVARLQEDGLGQRRVQQIRGTPDVVRVRPALDRTAVLPAAPSRVWPLQGARIGDDARCCLTQRLKHGWRASLVHDAKAEVAVVSHLLLAQHLRLEAFGPRLLPDRLELGRRNASARLLHGELKCTYGLQVKPRWGAARESGQNVPRTRPRTG